MNLSHISCDFVPLPASIFGVAFEAAQAAGASKWYRETRPAMGVRLAIRRAYWGLRASGSSQKPTFGHDNPTPPHGPPVSQAGATPIGLRIDALPKVVRTRLTQFFTHPVSSIRVFSTELTKMCLAFAALSSFALASETPMIPVSEAEQYVVLWRRVPSAYSSPDFSRAQIDQLLEKSPVRTLRMELGDTLSGRLQSQFRVNATTTPEMYGSLLSKVVELNHLKSADDLIAGQELLVPVIPKTSKQGALQGLSLAFSETDIAFTASEFSPAFVGEVAETEIQYFKVPIRELPLHALELNAQQGASGPIEVLFGQGAVPSSTPTGQVLEPELGAQLRLALSASRNGLNPTLVVVDDAIPDKDEYARARAFLLEVSNEIRETHGFKDSPYVAEINSPEIWSALNEDSTHYPSLVMHASVIKKALAPLIALDSGERVRVIYLPLSATQHGVSPILKELLYLAELLRIVSPSSVTSSSANPTQREAARRVVEMVVKSNPSVFEFGPVAFSSAGGKTLRSDRYLIEALSSVLDAYSRAAGQPHMLSFSWTTPKLSFPTAFVGSPYGLMFAAAGNRSSSPMIPDILESEVQFASRAVGPMDVVAVLNSDGQTGPCASNLFNDDSGIQVLSLSLTGLVDATHCGTSFSAPRVAWLVAAREAIHGSRPARPVSPQFRLAWYQSQRQRLLGMRSAELSSVLQRYHLDARKLLEIPLLQESSP